MTGALFILSATVIAGVLLYIWHRYELRKSGEDAEPEIEEPESQDGCCGQHAVCEKDSLLAGVSEKIIYYEDEELDVFKGMEPTEYSDDQIEQFRDVLYTLRVDEVAGWARSIQLRGINLPTIIQDELLMIVSEARDNNK